MVVCVPQCVEASRPLVAVGDIRQALRRYSQKRGAPVYCLLGDQPYSVGDVQSSRGELYARLVADNSWNQVDHVFVGYTQLLNIKEQLKRRRESRESY